MADIATIGFAADTSQLSQAEAKLNALPTAAGRAEKSSQRLAKMFESVDAAASKLQAAATGLSSAAEKLSSAANGAATASQKEATAINEVAAAATKSSTAKAASAKASQSQKAASDAAAAAAKTEADALNQVAAAAKKRTSVPTVGTRGFGSDPAQPWGPMRPQNDAYVDPLKDYDRNNPFQKIEQQAGAMRANVGNIAAQFQDIGVTAAMGMNPLLVALQQGTQLSSVFAQTGGNAFRTLGSALMSVISPVSLLTIGLVALATAGIQWFAELISKGQEANLTLAEQQKLIQSVAERFGDAAPQLQAYADALTGIKDATDAIAAGNAAAQAQFAGTTQALEGVNKQFTAMIRSLSGSPEARVFADKLTTSFANLRTKLDEGKATADDMKSAQDALADAMNNAGTPAVIAFGNAFGGIIGQINAAIKAAAGMRGEIGNLTAAANAALNDPKTWRGAAPNAARDMYSDDRAIQNFSDPQLPMNGPDITFRPSDLETAKNRGYVKPSGGGGKSDKEKYEDIVKGAEMATAALKAEYDAIGMNEEATALLKYETQLLNDAKQAGINLSGPQKDQLMALAGDMAQLASETKKAQEALNFSRDATKGFVQDLKSGLMEGKSLWESFTNSALNLANKLIDRGLNAIIDKLFEVGDATKGLGGSGGGGGLFGGIVSFIGKLFANAKGNAFGPSGIQAFANGGAFTNSVVSKPTMFAFANGGALGVMGEKDPEAIMPLKRGPDGSLGVQMHGGSGGGGQNVNTVNVNNTYRIEGAISEQRVVQQIRASAEQTKEDVKQNMMPWIGEYQRNGTMGTEN